ncbi:Protein CURVATURE THYLAKOID 1D chloroplastic [Zea mays]|jgi:hypothetical protein|uniref:Protein CURVATURE THYLAKOID 1D chloroplastic n=1 Tax=Zea mays TaxID=4577 RepID=A0A1D6HKY9_MAIZE|nr:Protein CURVATURE THYLAKOID 1D chloroplastic [Zea mays]
MPDLSCYGIFYFENALIIFRIKKILHVAAFICEDSLFFRYRLSCCLLIYRAYIFQLNIEVTPTLILTGFGAFIALWILSSVVAAVDSVPLVQKLQYPFMKSTVSFSTKCSLTCLADS